MSAPIDLTTLASLKTYLNINNTNDDTLLGSLITAASAWLGNVMNFTPAQASYTETRDGRNTMALMLKQWPVVSVASLTIDGLVIPASVANPGGGYTDGYIVDDSRVLLRGTTYRFNKGYQNIAVSYTAGFNPIPFDLAQACNALCAFWYKRRDRIGVQTKTLGPENITFSMDDAPKETKTTIAQYMRVFPRL